MRTTNPRLLVLVAVTLVVASSGFLGVQGAESRDSTDVRVTEELAQDATTTDGVTTTAPGVTDSVLRVCEQTIDGETTRVLTSERDVPLLQQEGWSCSVASPTLVQGLEVGTTTQATAETATETPMTTQELPPTSLLRVCERTVDDETVLVATSEADVALLQSEGWSCGLRLPVLIQELEVGTTTVEPGATTTVEPTANATRTTTA